MNTNKNNEDFLIEGKVSESETLPLPPLPRVPELEDRADYELIQMYQTDRNEKALMCLAKRYEGLAVKTLGVMRENWEQQDRKQTAFLVVIETINRINLSKINPSSYNRCFYLWYRQGLLNAIRDYKKQISDVRESVDITGDKCIIQYVGFDEEIHTTSISKDETAVAIAKLELWSLLDKDEAFVLELYLSGVSLRECAKRNTLYRLLNNAKTKIVQHYKEQGINVEF
jgi:hypothetical protein